MSQSSGGWSFQQWAIMLHLSQLANFIIPVSGFIVPVVIWQAKKGQFRELDAHGKVVANWLISSVIYSAGFYILSFVLIGVPLLYLMGLLAIGFPIYGAIKASEGRLWPYPFALRIVQ